MAKKRKQQGEAAATEAPEKVAEGEAPAAAADSATPRKASRRRGGDSTAEQEAAAAAHAPCPADSGKETTDREGKKPRLKKQKRNKRDQTPCASASDAAAAAMVKSGDDCADRDGVPKDAEVSMIPRNGDDPNCPEVNIAEKGTTEMKKPKRRKKKKKNMQERSPSAVSGNDALEVDKSTNDCKDVPGDDKTVRNRRNEEDRGFSSVEIAEQEIQVRKKKPRRRKRKNNNQEQSPSAVADGDVVVVVVGNSGNDCIHGKGVPGVADVSMNSRNGEDQDCPEVHIAEKETPQRKKPKLKKPKENKHEQSPAAVSDDVALQPHKSGNVCVDEDDPSGDAQVSMGTRNVEDPYRPEVNIAEKGTHERKKPKPKKWKNKKEGSSSVVLDAGAVVADESRNGCTDGDAAPQDIEPSICPRNDGDPDCPVVNNAEKGMQEMCKTKRKKRKNNQEQSPSAVLVASDVVVDKSGHASTNVGDPSGGADVTTSPRISGAVVADESRNGCTDGDGAPQDIEPSICPRTDGDPDCPVVNNAEKGIQEMCKPKRKKRNKNSQEQSPSAVLVASDVVVDKSGHTSTNVGDPSGRADVTMSPRIGEGPEYPRLSTTDDLLEVNKVNKDYSHEVNKEGSSSVVLHASAVVADEYINGCMDGDGAPQDMEPSICPRNDGDPGCPVVNNAEKGIQEMCKPKRKKRKKNSQEQSPSTVLVASDVVVDKSGHASTNLGDPSGRADVTMSPRIGEGPEYPRLNATDDLLEVNNVNKDYSHKPMKNKHDQSPSAAPDTCAVVEDKSVKSYIDGKGILGDTETSMSPRNGKDHDCSEVNIANELVEGKNGNNDNSQKPKNDRQKRKRRASVAVTETPRVDGFSSDERKDVCKTHSMKVTDKSVIISATSTSGENHKENIRNIYSPEGSLVRFQRKKLLILDLNGILADINTDSHVHNMADGRVRGKNVFKRNYLDDFLSFCFQNFELGIWSSRMKVNVDAVVDILMKDLRRHLVFCWDVSKCTTTNCATLENNRKPLVLKELKKLWNKEDPNLPWELGEFSPSNTLLVDDSPYKALRNPPYTAIFPQSYTYHNQGDNSLGPGGDLRVYLENIAAADDVQRYVQEHPFDQPSITESDPHWNFYAKIHYRLDSAGRKF